MHTLTKLEKAAANLHRIIAEEKGLEVNISKARAKTLTRIAGQIEALVDEQRQDDVAEAQRVAEEEAAKRAEAVAEVRALMEKSGITLRELRRPVPARKSKPRSKSAEVRQWARAQGIEVNALGIIPSAVMEAYSKAG